jgi:hypothetical protein
MGSPHRPRGPTHGPAGSHHSEAGHSPPVVIATLKNRTLSPVVERFLACARQVAKSFDPANCRQDTQIVSDVCARKA